MRSVLPVTLGMDEDIYVEYGFARFVDAETKTVAVDEPLVLLAATNWINLNHRSSYKFLCPSILLHSFLRALGHMTSTDGLDILASGQKITVRSLSVDCRYIFFFLFSI